MISHRFGVWLRRYFSNSQKFHIISGASDGLEGVRKAKETLNRT
jgi:hypothetical protein